MGKRPWICIRTPFLECLSRNFGPRSWHEIPRFFGQESSSVPRRSRCPEACPEAFPVTTGMRTKLRDCSRARVRGQKFVAPDSPVQCSPLIRNILQKFYTCYDRNFVMVNNLWLFWKINYSKILTRKSLKT